MFYLPSLSAYQTLENSQGTFDPLGLYSIDDRLAMRLVSDLSGHRSSNCYYNK